MEIMIKKIDSHHVDGNASDIASTFAVVENGMEFRITCRSNSYGRTFSLAGKEGTLYIERDDNKVHMQKVALGGGCGLIIDEEPIEGLSPLAIHGIIIGENNNGAKEITITDEHTTGQQTILIDGKKVAQFSGLNNSDIFKNL